MNAVTSRAAASTAAVNAPRGRPGVSLGVVGCGQVGSALLDCLSDFVHCPVALAGVCNSRVMRLDAAGLATDRGAGLLDGRQKATCLDALVDAVREAPGLPVIVDATASHAVARRHAYWLRAGIHVVTANKCAANARLAESGLPGCYGDSATVGAGLPVLNAIRRLRRAGDRIRRIEGVLSGSLAYIFHALQAGDAFSVAVERARDRGYTEPDPRTDLSGRDAACKLAVLARAAGLHCPAEPAAESLLPRALADAGEDEFWQALPASDGAWRARIERASRRRRVVRYVAAVGARGAPSVGLSAVDERDPLATTSAADNLIVIRSDAYRHDPLVIRGPGAGPGVTARALLADVVDVSARA